MTAEEEAAYAAVLEARRQKRAEERREYKRRAAFDPLKGKTASAPDSPPETGTPMRQRPPSRMGARRPTPELPSTSSSSGTAAAPDAAIPPAPAQAPRTPHPSRLPRGSAGEPQDDALDDAAFEAAAAAFLQDATAGDEVTLEAARPASARSARGVRRRGRTIAAPGTFRPGAAARSPSTPAPPKAPQPATAPRSQRSGRAVPRLGAPRQRGPLGGASAGLGGAEAQAVEQLADELDALGLSDEQIAAALADDDDDDDADEAEELDWDVLKAGESFEQHLQELQREEEDARVRRERAQVRARARGADDSAPAGAAAPSSASGAAAGPPGAADDDEDAQLESLLSFLEMVDKQEGAGAGARARVSGAASGSGSGVADGAPALEDAVDWGSLEKVFLGEGWDDDIREMARQARVAGADVSDTAGSGGGGGDEDDAPGWADEVTTLLLGLVGISHERYLDQPLLGRVDVPEDERADAYWNAPFALMVLDDSQQAMLEYANKKALALIGCEFDDIYDLSSFDIVDSSEATQQEWLWSSSEVEDKLGKHTFVPELQLRGRDGTAGAVARNVLLFRIDNLEGQPIGQAVVMRDVEAAAKQL